jgi:hypothetical protein
MSGVSLTDQPFSLLLRPPIPQWSRSSTTSANAEGVTLLGTRVLPLLRAAVMPADCGATRG